jgi:hypothetical protein
MKWKDEDLPALRELEHCVMQVWEAHDDMTDHTAGRAYEAGYKYYRSMARGGQPAAPALRGLDLETYEALQKVCEKLLTTGAEPFKGMSKQGVTNQLTTEKLVLYLRELSRSVEHHTKLGGRTGYLEFLSGYFPE